MLNRLHVIKDKIAQFFLVKKYKNVNVPVQKGNYWYLKEYMGLKQDQIYIEKYIDSSITHFENYANTGLCYEYIYGEFKDVSKDKIKEFQDFVHSHSFYQVLETVYYFPESFKVLKEDLFLYSDQEIHVINKLQKKCLEDGLKDIGYHTLINDMVRLVYSIDEVNKRKITKVYGYNIKKYLKNNNCYLKFDENNKIQIIK